MSRHSPAWHDAQYHTRAAIPEHLAILQHWFDSSAQARSSLPCQLDLAYGADASERLDIFHPAAARQAPVLVYIHGGYWRALDKRDQSFVATPFVQAGAVVVLPNHALAPAVSLRHIVLQLVMALAWVQRHIRRFGGDPARISVAGHSAGGHLAAMLLACQWQRVAPDLPPQLLRQALVISGLFELEPLRHAPFLAADLGLSADEARQLSPARLPPPAQGRLLAVVGGDESSEFRRQTRLIRRAWGAERVPVCEQLPGRHHMNVLNLLAEPGTRLQALALDMLGLCGCHGEGGSERRSGTRLSAR